MSDCSSNTASNKHDCPACGHAATAVSAHTMSFHLLHPWQWQDDAHYFFCDRPDCDVIYFSDAGAVWHQGELRTQVGVKHPTPDALVCYCYGVHYAEADAATRHYIIEQTRTGACACTTHNPSGHCCLKDMPR
jgi:hypothetical protein